MQPAQAGLHAPGSSQLRYGPAPLLEEPILKRTILLAVALALTVPHPAEAQSLSYERAKSAVQRKANALAGQRTTVSSLRRTGPRRYYAQARWSYVDPDGCKGCDTAPDGQTAIDTPLRRSCSATFTVRQDAGSRRVIVSVQSRSCA